MNGDLLYNANNLQTYDPLTRVGINTNKILHTDMPNTSGDVQPIANASDSTVPNSEHPNKLVRLAGTIHGSSQVDLDDRIDTFKGYFGKRNVNLDITYSSGVRRYKAMKVNALTVERQDKALFAAFNVELICKPFGIETTPTVLLNVANDTDPSRTLTPTIGGSAPFQLPIVTFTIDALTGAGDYVLVSNDLNGQQLIVTGQVLEAGDVVVINSETHSVTVNGEEVDYSGTFIELEPGPASFTITDGFTTRTVDILVEYYKRYL